MFQSVVNDATQAEKRKVFLAALALAVLIVVPFETVEYLHYSGLEDLASNFDAWVHWFYFPVLIVGVCDGFFEIPPLGWTFLLKPAISWIHTLINIGFHAIVVWWCWYSVTDGYVEGIDSLRLRRYWPFRIGTVTFTAALVLRGAAYSYGRFVGFGPSHTRVLNEDPLDAFLLGVLMYPGGLAIVLSVVIVAFRRLWSRRSHG